MSRTLQKVIAISMCIVSCTCLGYTQSQPISKTHKEIAKTSPNFVFIIADDQGYADVGYKQMASDVITPNIDRIAQQGVDFTQAYVSSPICSTSRTSIITGSYAQRLGMYWYGGKGLEDSTFSTLTEMLKLAGYTNGYIGKYHYGNSKLPNDRNFPLNHGIDYFYGFEGGRKHYLVHDDEQQKAFNKAKKQNKGNSESLALQSVWINDQRVKQSGFSTELIEEHAVEFIEKNKHKPFYLQVAFNALHNFTHQLPDEYLSKHNLPKMSDWDPSAQSFRDWYVAGRSPNNSHGRAYYLGQLYYLDKAVGAILDTLQKNKLSDNTIIVYISDNGGSRPIYADNGVYRGSKYTLYEGGIRVPMLINVPDTLAGKSNQAQTIDHLVSTMDIYPTLLKAAGVAIPAHIDGVPLNDLLAKGEPLSRDALVWDTGHELAVRSGKWKYHRVYDDFYAGKQMVALEKGEFLYDMASDPSETVNLINQHPDIAVRLKSIHQQWSKQNKFEPTRVVARKKKKH